MTMARRQNQNKEEEAVARKKARRGNEIESSVKDSWRNKKK
jgi:hypothetical protein